MDQKILLRILIFQQRTLEILIWGEDKIKAKKLLEETRDLLHKTTRDVDLTEGNSLNDNILWFGEDLGKEVTELLEYFSKD